MPRICLVPAFSLVELMIGIVILGLGLVLVATMFPVAWYRARELNEYTMEQTLTSAADATIRSMLRVSSVSDAGGPTVQDSTSFLGDLLFRWVNINGVDYRQPVGLCPVPGAPALTWVHPLTMWNIQVAPRQFVAEELWKLQFGGTLQNALTVFAEYAPDVETRIIEHSYFRPLMGFHQRVHPTMRLRNAVDENGAFTRPDTVWDDDLDMRRFTYAVFHRRRTAIEIGAGGVADLDKYLQETRAFDLYYVVLRRGRPADRYARQDWNPNNLPNPCELEQDPVAAAARPGGEDVMFPVPWRVQVEFPPNLELQRDPITGASNPNLRGAPTEISVPPARLSAGEGTKAMSIAMFPPGAFFIDELSGNVYRVINRRLASAAGDRAVLTLDRPVFLEYLDLPENDLRCDTCTTLQDKALMGQPVIADNAELVRTVWVFPPPVEPDSGTQPGPRTFDGAPPVVNIEVRTLHVSPAS